MRKNESLQAEIIELAKAAIRFRTTADRPEEKHACLDMLLGRLGDAPLVIDRREHDGVPSAVVRPRGVDRPRVILCGHLDVVPGEEGQFEPRLEGDRLYGRGALDMKGSLAALTVLFRRTAAAAPPWWLVMVSDEEVGGKNGAARLAAENWPAELFVAAEPSKMTLSLQSKGALRLELVHRGRRAHASTPWLGDSSVERMMGVGPAIRKVVPEVKEDAWRTTACLSIIKGGTVINQVPDECRLYIDIRYVPGDDPARITADLVKALPGIEVGTIDVYPPMVCREDVPLVASLKSAFRAVSGVEAAIGREHGATDARYFSDRMDALIFGPDGEDIHGPSEWISVQSLSAFAEIMDRWGAALRRPTA